MFVAIAFGILDLTQKSGSCWNCNRLLLSHKSGSITNRWRNGSWLRLLVCLLWNCPRRCLLRKVIPGEVAPTKSFRSVPAARHWPRETYPSRPLRFRAATLRFGMRYHIGLRCYKCLGRRQKYMYAKHTCHVLIIFFIMFSFTADQLLSGVASGHILSARFRNPCPRNKRGAAASR